MKKHLGFLLDLKRQYLEGDTASPQDAEYGFWSIKKLIAVNYLIPQFGMLASRGRFFHCFYLDLLAGSGLVRLDGETFPGSAIVALAAQTTSPHFQKYFFIESNSTKAVLLEKRLSRVAQSVGNRTYSVLPIDCNEALPKVLGEIYDRDAEHSCFLALFDPEGYTETGWSAVETLVGRGKGDLIFNFTEGVARNVQIAKTDKSYIPALRQYFGEPEDEWLQLNGYAELIEHFRTKFSSVNGIARTTFRVDVQDEENRPLYGLLLATGSSGVANIIDDLKKRLDSTRVIDLKNIYAELTGKSTTLTKYLLPTKLEAQTQPQRL
jgi:three-Cys-motif partner protein